MDPNPPRRPRGRARGQSQGAPPNQDQPRGAPPNQDQPRGAPPNQDQPRGQPRGATFNRGQPRGFPSAQAPPSRPRPNMPGQFNPRQEFRPQNVRNIYF